MFSNFIMLVIMFNCACMVLENPPHWIDDYLEYVFTAIYIAEATVKIIARGFVLHNFSYLRDPWNWLDFIVIIIKAILQSTMLGQIAVLRTFRVLRALKTMSVVPGLRGIVKALLRSIHALKDAVALTVFCVSVFALIGYQLFHGTLRQKCVLNSGTFDLAPNALYAIDRRQDIFNWDMDINNFTSTLQDYNTSTNSKVSSSHSAMTPLYQQQENCNTLRTLPECDGTSCDMCPLGYTCNEAGDNPDFGYTSFDHFFLAFLTSFRLVALDSWSRLYYLTLHTIGKTYAIFYILVVLLGSYYLVNLILAVVYMAYEEQQAVVEEEELVSYLKEWKQRNGKLRKGNRRLVKYSCCFKLSIIVKVLYFQNAAPLPNVIKKYSPNTYSDTCTCSDDSSMYQYGDAGTRKRRRPTSKGRRRRYRRKSPINLETQECPKTHNGGAALPNIRLIVTEIDSDRERDRRSSGFLNNSSSLLPGSSANSNFLSVNSAFSRGRSSVSSETSSVVETSSAWGDNESEQVTFLMLLFSQNECELSQKSFLRLPLINVVDHPSDNSVKLNTTLLEPTRNRDHRLSATSMQLQLPTAEKKSKERSAPPPVTQNKHRNRSFSVGAGLSSTAKSKREKWKLKNKTVKDKYRKLSRAFVNTFCKWRCCPASWSKIQRKVRKIVLNPFTDLLITLCIALNTLFMSLEHHPMETWFSKLLDQANFFTIVFTVEMLMKIIGLSPYTYFKERWNVFDAVVVLFSLLELLISSTQGLSVFRAFRLMRILKLAKQWPTLNKLLRIIGRTLGQLWHLTLVLFLVLFIFAVVGMQLLRDSYLTYYNEHNQGKQPRWNFVDFSHSFMVVFRIQCGEWVENMFNCINVASPGVCIPLFILVYIIGNLVILNLFLALLLNSFSGDVLQQTTSKNSSISEAFRRFAVWARRQRIKIQNIPFNLGVRNTPKNPINPLKTDVRKSMSQQTDCSVITNTETTFMNAANKKDNNIIANECAVKPTSRSEHEPPKEQRLKVKHRSRQLSTCSSLQSDSTMSKLRTSRTTSLDSRPESRRAHQKSRVSETNSVPVSPEHTVGRSRLASIKARERYRGMCSSGGETSTGERDLQPCFSCWKSEPTSGPWFEIRRFVNKIIIHKYFENFVIFCILISTVTLAMEDIHIDKRPAMKRVVQIVDIFCCIFFTIEMLMKWIGKGLKSYFTNPWCCLDFFIVIVSIINLSLVANQRSDFSALRALRTFRALRPLRALSRFQGMKIVVDALVRAVPSITQVFVICMIFWLIFSILGVNIFGGRFGRCVSLLSGDIMPNPLLDFLITSCLNFSRMNTTLINWQIPNVNFDSAPRGLLALLQIATFTGWLEIMGSAVDITGIESQPRYEASFYNYLYFCVFIIFGAFFSLNLFIGVIIDNFNQQKIKTTGGEDGVFLTDEQRRYYNAMKRMASKTPKKPIPRPNSRFANKIYDIVTDRKFEIAVMGLIMLNLVVMAIEHHDMSPKMYRLLQNFNLGFICIFLLEAILKLIGLRLYYFTVPWNVFDILVVVVSLIGDGLQDVMTQYFVQPTIFRIIRLFRVTRILRLIREAKGIRTLLFALMMSLPALFNIGSLLFLLMFIYAIIGMSQFPYIQKVAGVDSLLNFETFPNAFLVLFQISTSEGWDTFIEPVLRDREPYCVEKPEDGSPSNCGNSTIGVIYFVTYVMITFLIVVNMYIAIILENFEVATRESAEPLTADDFEQFFEVWQRFDDRLTQYVSYDQLKSLLNQLDYPLRVAHPNGAFISQAHMKVTLDGNIHCLEVIITLIKKVLGDSPELSNLKDSMLQSFQLKCPTKESLEDQETIDSEEFTVRLRAVLIIQQAYRDY
uniref:Sodium channel protein n=1 Tax=Ciona savignyi TaxID=51511 RepID=H2ZPU8_CIOSA